MPEAAAKNRCDFSYNRFSCLLLLRVLPLLMGAKGSKAGEKVICREGFVIGSMGPRSSANFRALTGIPVMIEPIRDLPDNVLGFSAKGIVTKVDYETAIIPAVEAKFSKYTRVRFLYHTGEDFTKFESGALWDDVKIGFKHLTSWERIAVVTDVDWIQTAVRIFAFLLHGSVRVFQNAEIAEASRWISE